MIWKGLKRERVAGSDECGRTINAYSFSRVQCFLLSPLHLRGRSEQDKDHEGVIDNDIHPPSNGMG